MKKNFLTLCLIVLAFASLMNADSVRAQNGHFQKNKTQKLQPNEGQLGRPGNQRKLPPIFNPRRFPSGNKGGLDNRPNNPAIVALQKQRKRMLMEALGLTPEQRLRIANIDRQHQDDAAAIGRRLRQSRAALDHALMSETYNEALVKQLTEEVATAQAEQIRLNVRVRSEFRSVLTNEQVHRFIEKEREIQQQLRELKQRELMNQQETQKPPDKEKDGFDEQDVESALLDLIR
ncbi:MAG: Spy/CpxP family protein refolding chaperone [Acidobacteria bacterium]|nr:Spy/CpxP family protein refolding chaperone [Acidobacteriota bacterium]